MTRRGQAHALIVAPLVDGMNLVAKEGPVVNERDGVLVLSEGAGASEELAEVAPMVPPYELVDMAEAMHPATARGERERKEKARALRARVEQRSVTDRLYNQLLDFTLLPS